MRSTLFAALVNTVASRGHCVGLRIAAAGKTVMQGCGKARVARLPHLLIPAMLFCLVCLPAAAQEGKQGNSAQKGELAAIRKAADQGYAKAQFNLGTMYDSGRGVPQDYAQAAIWYRKAAVQGYAAAQFNLGVMYGNGYGVPQDYAQAAIWYRKAAHQGLAEAQFNLGTMYDFGHGVPQDYAQAVLWYRKAADQGYALAQVNLGAIYGNGYGVPQDYAQAAIWYRKAADQGLAEAQLSLGAMYYFGHGVPQDYAQAYFWCDLAASGKIGSSSNVKKEDVYKLRDEAASRLPPADLSRLQERARKWFEDHPAKP